MYTLPTQRQPSPTLFPYTTLFRSTIDAISVKVGENIAPGMPAVRVVNTSDLKIQAPVSEAYVTDIKKGDKVLVSISELDKEVDRKSTRLNSSHLVISYAVFCLKKK